MASVIYVFHIASLYDRRGDEIAGADMIVHNSKTALHDISHSIGLLCSVFDNVRQPTNWRQIRPARE